MPTTGRFSVKMLAEPRKGIARAVACSAQLLPRHAHAGLDAASEIPRKALVTAPQFAAAATS